MAGRAVAGGRLWQRGIFATAFRLVSSVKMEVSLEGDSQLFFVLLL